MTVEIRNVDDGEMIEVRVTEFGCVRTGLVSSMHLVQPKVNQLQQAIREEMAAAYVDS